jgi:hypothetical protein
MYGLTTICAELGIGERSLFDALPQKLELRVLSVNHSAFSVFTGDEEEVVVVLKFEPADIVDTAQIWFV